MKKSCFFLILILGGMQIFAQKPIKDQPGQAYFDWLEKIIIEKTIAEKDFLAAKPGNIPENFMDTLKKHDWVYLGGYFYSDQKYTSHKNLYKEYKILRYDENGGQLEFSINGYQNYVINSLNFTNPPRKKVSVLKSNNSVYLQNITPDEKSYQRVLSYANGTWIYLVTYSGKMNDNNIAFRDYYTAIPKKFSWKYDE
jgi:hypothetical protein